MVFLSEFNNVSKIFVSAEIWLKRRYDDAVGNIIEQGTNKKAGKTSTHNEAAVSTRRVTKIPTKNTVIQHHTYMHLPSPITTIQDQSYTCTAKQSWEHKLV